MISCGGGQTAGVGSSPSGYYAQPNFYQPSDTTAACRVS